MTTEEFLQAGEFEFDAPCEAHCLDCTVLIQETVTGARDVDGGTLCRTCYYARIGEFVEEHPIASSQMAVAQANE